MEVKQKVFAYITTRRGLLVFRHTEYPEAGIQVPAGTVASGERLEDAVLREAFEETGLRGLQVESFLGEQRRDMSDFGKAEIHQRFFYHLSYSGDVPATWRHVEAASVEGRFVFEFFWVRPSEAVSLLIADHGFLLPRLLEVLAAREEIR